MALPGRVMLGNPFASSPGPIALDVPTLVAALGYTFKLERPPLLPHRTWPQRWFRRHRRSWLGERGFCGCGSPSWRRNWEHVVPFFAFPESVRRIIYTTNQIEALNSNCAGQYERADTADRGHGRKSPHR